MDLGLTGRTAVVLGASQGMGLAIAEGLVAEGAKVAMFARRADVVEREAERLGAAPGARSLVSVTSPGPPTSRGSWTRPSRSSAASTSSC